MKEVNEYQADLLADIMNFFLKKKKKTKKSRKKSRKENCFNFFEGVEKVLDAFESRIFLIKSKGAGFLNLDRSK